MEVARDDDAGEGTLGQGEPPARLEVRFDQLDLRFPPKVAHAGQVAVHADHGMAEPAQGA